MLVWPSTTVVIWKTQQWSAQVCVCVCVSVYSGLQRYVCVCMYVSVFVCVCMCEYVCVWHNADCSCALPYRIAGYFRGCKFS